MMDVHVYVTYKADIDLTSVGLTHAGSPQVVKQLYSWLHNCIPQLASTSVCDMDLQLRSDNVNDYTCLY